MVLETEISICRRMKADPRLSFSTKTNSKWIKHLKVMDTLKLLEEKIGKTLQDTAIGKDFLKRSLLTMKIHPQKLTNRVA